MNRAKKKHASTKTISKVLDTITDMFRATYGTTVAPDDAAAKNTTKAIRVRTAKEKKS